LAAELQEQLDQEYTSLLSSIDEVQGLMEAEVAGVELLPPLEELEAFAIAAEAALRSLEHQIAECRQKQKAACKLKLQDEDLMHEGTLNQKDPCSPGSPSASHAGVQPETVQSEQLQSELLDDVAPDGPLEALREKEARDSTDAVVGDSLVKQQVALHNCASPSASSPRRRASGISISFCIEEASAEILRVGGDGRSAAGDAGTSNDVMERPAARPRWADLSDDEEVVLPSAIGRRPCPPRLSAEDALPPEASEGMADDGSGQERAKAQCGRCMELLGKENFSRRAWRQARGLGGAGAATAAERAAAICRSCLEAE
jgi:hypothetical protein